MISLVRGIVTVLFVSILCWAIGSTDNESWLMVWFILLIFLGVPLSLMTLRDLASLFTPKWLGRSQVLLHVCALFGAVIGYYVGVMAFESEHPKVHLHQYMVVVFPALVYLAPLLMVFNGVPLSNIKKFYFKSGSDSE